MQMLPWKMCWTRF